MCLGSHLREATYASRLWQWDPAEEDARAAATAPHIRLSIACAAIVAVGLCLLCLVARGLQSAAPYDGRDSGRSAHLDNAKFLCCRSSSLGTISKILGSYQTYSKCCAEPQPRHAHPLGREEPPAADVRDRRPRRVLVAAGCAAAGPVAARRRHGALVAGAALARRPVRAVPGAAAGRFAHLRAERFGPVHPRGGATARGAARLRRIGRRDGDDARPAAAGAV